MLQHLNTAPLKDEVFHSVPRCVRHDPGTSDAPTCSIIRIVTDVSAKQQAAALNIAGSPHNALTVSATQRVHIAIRNAEELEPIADVESGWDDWSAI